MVRLAASICSLIFAALLAWVVVVAVIQPDPMVVPSNGVIGSASKDPLPTGAQASASLAERTKLQRWRAESGPSPRGQTTDSQSLSDAPMKGGDGSARHINLPAGWLAERDRDWPVLVDRGYTAGVASLPAARDAVFMQPQGRDFRRHHEGTISYAGGIIVFGMALALSLFLLIRGRVPLAKGFSGAEITRFSAVERANHWLTASGFIVLALTGLILIYGWALLEPLLGPRLYAPVAQASLYLHVAFAAPFILGICVMAVLWLRQNLPSRLDLHWIARFGGFLSNSGKTPPAQRFNAGQKLVFWGVVLGGLLMFLTGITLMFPFFWTDVHALQWTLLGHGLLALMMVGLILGHIYIGTIGMEGAFDAMWEGRVDRNWAEEHHKLWLEELESGRRPHTSASPAE